MHHEGRPIVEFGAGDGRLIRQLKKMNSSTHTSIVMTDPFPDHIRGCKTLSSETFILCIKY